MGIISKVKKAVKDTVQKVKTTAQAAYNRVAQGVSSAISTAKSYVSQGVQTVKSVVSNAVSTVTSAAKTAATATVNLVKSVAQKGVSVVKSATSGGSSSSAVTGSGLVSKSSTMGMSYPTPPPSNVQTLQSTMTPMGETARGDSYAPSAYNSGSGFSATPNQPSPQVLESSPFSEGSGGYSVGEGQGGIMDFFSTTNKDGSQKSTGLALIGLAAGTVLLMG